MRLNISIVHEGTTAFFFFNISIISQSCLESLDKWTLPQRGVNSCLGLNHSGNLGACSLRCHLPVVAYKLTFLPPRSLNTVLLFSSLFFPQSKNTQLLHLSSLASLFSSLLFHLISLFLAPGTKSAFWLIKFDKHS